MKFAWTMLTVLCPHGAHPNEAGEANGTGHRSSGGPDESAPDLHLSMASATYRTILLIEGGAERVARMIGRLRQAYAVGPRSGRWFTRLAATPPDPGAR